MGCKHVAGLVIWSTIAISGAARDDWKCAEIKPGAWVQARCSEEQPGYIITSTTESSTKHACSQHIDEPVAWSPITKVVPCPSVALCQDLLCNMAELEMAEAQCNSFNPDFEYSASRSGTCDEGTQPGERVHIGDESYLCCRGAQKPFANAVYGFSGGYGIGHCLNTSAEEAPWLMHFRSDGKTSELKRFCDDVGGTFEAEDCRSIPLCLPNRTSGNSWGFWAPNTNGPSGTVQCPTGVGWNGSLGASVILSGFAPEACAAINGKWEKDTSPHAAVATGPGDCTVRVCKGAAWTTGGYLPFPESRTHPHRDCLSAGGKVNYETVNFPSDEDANTVAVVATKEISFKDTGMHRGPKNQLPDECNYTPPPKNCDEPNPPLFFCRSESALSCGCSTSRFFDGSSERSRSYAATNFIITQKLTANGRPVMYFNWTDNSRCEDGWRVYVEGRGTQFYYSSRSNARLSTAESTCGIEFCSKNHDLKEMFCNGNDCKKAQHSDKATATKCMEYLRINGFKEMRLGTRSHENLPTSCAESNFVGRDEHQACGKTYDPQGPTHASFLEAGDFPGKMLTICIETRPLPGFRIKSSQLPIGFGSALGNENAMLSSPLGFVMVASEETNLPYDPAFTHCVDYKVHFLARVQGKVMRQGGNEGVDGVFVYWRLKPNSVHVHTEVDIKVTERCECPFAFGGYLVPIPYCCWRSGAVVQKTEYHEVSDVTVTGPVGPVLAAQKTDISGRYMFNVDLLGNYDREAEIEVCVWRCDDDKGGAPKEVSVDSFLAKTPSLLPKCSASNSDDFAGLRPVGPPNSEGCFSVKLRSSIVNQFDILDKSVLSIEGSVTFPRFSSVLRLEQWNGQNVSRVPTNLNQPLCTNHACTLDNVQGLGFEDPQALSQTEGYVTKSFRDTDFPVATLQGAYVTATERGCFCDCPEYIAEERSAAVRKERATWKTCNAQASYANCTCPCCHWTHTDSQGRYDVQAERGRDFEVRAFYPGHDALNSLNKTVNNLAKNTNVNFVDETRAKLELFAVLGACNAPMLTLDEAKGNGNLKVGATFRNVNGYAFRVMLSLGTGSKTTLTVPAAGGVEVEWDGAYGTDRYGPQVDLFFRRAQKTTQGAFDTRNLTKRHVALYEYHVQPTVDLARGKEGFPIGGVFTVSSMDGQKVSLPKISCRNGGQGRLPQCSSADDCLRAMAYGGEPKGDCDNEAGVCRGFAHYYALNADSTPAKHYLLETSIMENYCDPNLADDLELKEMCVCRVVPLPSSISIDQNIGALLQVATNESQADKAVFSGTHLVNVALDAKDLAGVPRPTFDGRLQLKIAPQVKGIPFPPYRKALELGYADQWEQKATARLDVIVEGVAPPNAALFVEAPTHLPLLILHDPPGSCSRSYAKRGGKFSVDLSVRQTKSNGDEANMRTAFGSKLETEEGTALGAIVAYSASLGMKGTSTETYADMKMTASRSNDDASDGKVRLEFEFAEELSTSDASLDPGSPSDVVVTLGLTLRFQQTIHVKVEGECVVEKDVTRWMPVSPADVANNPKAKTEYLSLMVKTIRDISETSLPMLNSTRKNIMGSDGGTGDDESETLVELSKYEQHWKQVLELNNVAHGYLESPQNFKEIAQSRKRFNQQQDWCTKWRGLPTRKPTPSPTHVPSEEGEPSPSSPSPSSPSPTDLCLTFDKTSVSLFNWNDNAGVNPANSRMCKGYDGVNPADVFDMASSDALAYAEFAQNTYTSSAKTCVDNCNACFKGYNKTNATTWKPDRPCPIESFQLHQKDLQDVSQCTSVCLFNVLSAFFGDHVMKSALALATHAKYSKDNSKLISRTSQLGTADRHELEGRQGTFEFTDLLGGINNVATPTKAILDAMKAKQAAVETAEAGQQSAMGAQAAADTRYADAMEEAVRMDGEEAALNEAIEAREALEEANEQLHVAQEAVGTANNAEVASGTDVAWITLSVAATLANIAMGIVISDKGPRGIKAKGKWNDMKRSDETLPSAFTQKDCRAAKILIDQSKRNRIDWSGGGTKYSYELTATNAFKAKVDRAQTITMANEKSTVAESKAIGIWSESSYSDDDDANVVISLEFAREPGREDHETFGFELCDATEGDTFVTDVGWDPLYGTPIFRTQAGSSRCPHEEDVVDLPWHVDSKVSVTNTTDRDKFQMHIVQGAENCEAAPPEMPVWDQAAEAKNVNPDAFAEFCVKIERPSNGLPDSKPVDYHVMVTNNPQGAVIHHRGKVIGNEDVIPFLNVGYTEGDDAKSEVFEVIRISRGPVEYDYEDITLSASPVCSQEAAVGMDPVYKQTDLTQVTATVTFAIACPMLAWAPKMLHSGPWFIAHDATSSQGMDPWFESLLNSGSPAFTGWQRRLMLEARNPNRATSPLNPCATNPFTGQQCNQATRCAANTSNPYPRVLSVQVQYRMKHPHPAASSDNNGPWHDTVDEFYVMKPVRDKLYPTEKNSVKTYTENNPTTPWDLRVWWLQTDLTQSIDIYKRKKAHPVTSPFGDASAYLSMENLPDGEYDLRLKTSCCALPDMDLDPSNAGLIYSYTEELPGVVDTHGPQLLRLSSEPAGRAWRVGDPVTLVFDEPFTNPCPGQYYGFNDAGNSDASKPDSAELKVRISAEGGANCTAPDMSGATEFGVECHGRTIAVAMSSRCVQKLRGKLATVSVGIEGRYGVPFDVYGNPAAGPQFFEFEVAEDVSLEAAEFAWVAKVNKAFPFPSVAKLEKAIGYLTHAGNKAVTVRVWRTGFDTEKSKEMYTVFHVWFEGGVPALRAAGLFEEIIVNGAQSFRNSWSALSNRGAQEGKEFAKYVGYLTSVASTFQDGALHIIDDSNHHNVRTNGDKEYDGAWPPRGFEVSLVRSNDEQCSKSSSALLVAESGTQRETDTRILALQSAVDEILSLLQASAATCHRTCVSLPHMRASLKKLDATGFFHRSGRRQDRGGRVQLQAEKCREEAPPRRPWYP